MPRGLFLGHLRRDGLGFARLGRALVEVHALGPVRLLLGLFGAVQSECTEQIHRAHVAGACGLEREGATERGVCGAAW